MILSILIPTVPSRKAKVAKLLSTLEALSELHEGVEILCLYDNKKMTVGEKRNALLKIARGRYFAFIDDDDDVNYSYFSKITEAISEHPSDLITFNVGYYSDLEPHYICDYADGTRLPAHVHVWNREKFGGKLFPERNAGEDVRWIKNIMSKVDSVYHIPQTLYSYVFNSKLTETQK